MVAPLMAGGSEDKDAVEEKKRYYRMFIHAYLECQ
jgi:hypothetical protein